MDELTKCGKFGTKNQLQARIRHTQKYQRKRITINMRNIGLRAQLREDTGLSLAEAVFVAQIVLPNEFLQNDEFSVDTIVNKFSKTLHVSAPSLPRRNSSTDLPSELPAELFSAPLIWVSRGGLVPPLQPLYNSPHTRSCATAPALHRQSRVT
jgi:hypothetical protein